MSRDKKEVLSVLQMFLTMMVFMDILLFQNSVTCMHEMDVSFRVKLHLYRVNFKN